MAYKPKKHVWTWRQAVAESDVSTHTKALCWTLALDLSDAGRYVQISVKEIMRLSGMSNRSVATHVEKAVEAGLLVEPERRYDSKGHVIATRYRLRFPDHMELSREPSETLDELGSPGGKSQSEGGSSRAKADASLSEPPAGLSEGGSRQGPDSDLEDRKEAATTAAAARAPDAATERSELPKGSRRRKGDLFSGVGLPKPESKSPELTEAYRLLQAAFAVHGRHYEPSTDRDRLLRDLIASRDMAYIERFAAKIHVAKALPRLKRLQTNQIVENEETRAKLFDGEYDSDHADEKAAPKADAPKEKRAAAQKPVYTPEFMTFWELCPATSRAKGGMPEAFTSFQEGLEAIDRVNVMEVLNAGVWEDTDDPQYAMNVKRWLDGECWKALAEYHGVAQYKYAETQVVEADASEDEEDAAAGDIDDDSGDLTFDVPDPIDQREAWLHELMQTRFPSEEILRINASGIKRLAGKGAKLLQPAALEELRQVVSASLCDSRYEYYIEAGSWIDFELGSRVDEAMDALFFTVGELIECNGKCPKSWTAAVQERNGLDYDEAGNLVPRGDLQPV